MAMNLRPSVLVLATIHQHNRMNQINSVNVAGHHDRAALGSGIVINLNHLTSIDRFHLKHISMD